MATKRTVSKRQAKPSDKKIKMRSEIKSEMIALVTASLGVVYGLFLYTEFTGIVGGIFKNISLGFFGIPAFLLPLIVFAMGVHIAIQSTEFGSGQKYGAAVFLVALISAMTQVSQILVDYSHGRGFIASIIDNYINGVYQIGGGVVGWFIGGTLKSLVGEAATWVILISLFILTIMIATDWSPIKYLLKAMIVGMQKLKAWFLQKSLERKQVKQEAPAKVPPAVLKPETKDDTYNVFDDDIIFENNAFIKKITDDTKIEDIVKPDAPKTVPAAGFEPKINVYTSPAGEDNGQMMIKTAEIKTPLASKEKPKEHETKDDLTDKPEFELPQGLKQYERVDYTFPPIGLLGYSKNAEDPAKSKAELKNTAQKLVDTLKSFGVEVKLLQVSKGPTVTRYELQPSAGVKVSKIVNLSDDIALNLAALGVRIEAPIPGKSAIGIEVPNKEISSVALREVIETKEFKNHPSNLAFGIGKDISGKAIIADISKMPHVLIAGATGSGKSVCINTLITSLLYKSDPNDVKLLMVDPKVVELGIYNGIPHLLVPVVTDPRKAAGALNWAVQEMVMRYKLFADNNVRDISGYNSVMEIKGIDFKLPHIVIIIDELADLMMVAPNDVEDSICRLAQMARAAGMHLVIATQRPSVDVITGIIKANIPSRISFAVSSQIDSRTILDMAGAEKLLGRGDMLYFPIGNSKPVRLQGSFVSDKEVESIVDFIKSHSQETKYDEDVLEKIEKGEKVSLGGEPDPDDDADPLLPQAIELVIDAGQGSASYMQRKLKVGFSRASRLIDQMEERGILGPPDGSKPRALLVSREQMYGVAYGSDAGAGYEDNNDF